MQTEGPRIRETAIFQLRKAELLSWRAFQFVRLFDRNESFLSPFCKFYPFYSLTQSPKVLTAHGASRRDEHLGDAIRCAIRMNFGWSYDSNDV